MKKFILFSLLICTAFISSAVWADDSDSDVSGYNWIKQDQQNQEENDMIKRDQWDQIYNQTVDEKFGSDASPAFLNRENIDSPRTNNGFDGG